MNNNPDSNDNAGTDPTGNNSTPVIIPFPAASLPVDDLNDRMGKFSLRMDTLRNNPRLALMVMATVVIVRAEMMFATNSVEYVAMCDEFEAGATGDALPVYHPVISTNERGERLLAWFSDAALCAPIPDSGPPETVSFQPPEPTGPPAEGPVPGYPYPN